MTVSWCSAETLSACNICFFSKSKVKLLFSGVRVRGPRGRGPWRGVPRWAPAPARRAFPLPHQRAGQVAGGPPGAAARGGCVARVPRSCHGNFPQPALQATPASGIHTGNHDRYISSVQKYSKKRYFHAPAWSLIMLLLYCCTRHLSLFLLCCLECKMLKLYLKQYWLQNVLLQSIIERPWSES